MVAEGMRSESRDTRRSRSTGGTEAGTETGTETTQTEGRMRASGPESEATSESGMFSTSVSSRQKGSFITREGESIDKITKAVVLTRIQNMGNLITNLKKKLL